MATILSELPHVEGNAQFTVVADGRIRIYPDLIQGSEEWLAVRCGLLTASEMHLIVTPKTLKAAANDKERAHLYELLAQRITRYVEPSYVSDDMLRGLDDEWEALRIYAEADGAEVQRVGFMTNDRFGFPLGYSPDALVGDDGQVECKSRRAKFQIETILNAAVPPEHVMQLQTGLLVSERQWVDYVSYSGGLPMLTLRVYPDPVVQEAILEAATAFEFRLSAALAKYREQLASDLRTVPTERIERGEMIL